MGTRDGFEEGTFCIFEVRTETIGPS